MIERDKMEQYFLKLNINDEIFEIKELQRLEKEYEVINIDYESNL